MKSDKKWTLWPGDKFPVGYDINKLYEVMLAYVWRHPKGTYARTHWYCVQAFGACAHHHAKAVWTILQYHRKNERAQTDASAIRSQD